MRAEGYTPSSERAFMNLKGDFTEFVKLTFLNEKISSLSGFYVFERTDKTNLFVRKTKDSDLIHFIRCETQYLEFESNNGVMPKDYHYDYRTMSLINGAEYDLMKKRLSEINEQR